MTGKMKDIIIPENVGVEMPIQGGADPVQISLPESQVHGGSLTAMLRGGIGGVGASSNNNQTVCGLFAQEKSYILTFG